MSENGTDRDNEQVSPPSLADLGYLAGIIDAEGSIGINRNAVQGKRFRLYPYVFIGNVNPAMIDFCDEMLGRLDAVPWIAVKRRLGENGKPDSDFVELWVRPYAKIQRLLTTLLPYLKAKAPQARLILRFIERRLARGTGRGHTFDDDDVAMADEMKHLNLVKGRTSEAACVARAYRRADEESAFIGGRTLPRYRILTREDMARAGARASE